MRKRLRIFFAALWLPLVAPLAGAASSGFTDPATFMAALPTPATTVDFESATPGATLPSGSSLGDITVTYDFDGVRMAAYDAFPSTSGAISLGTEDARIFQDGDGFGISFGPSHAVGLYIVTRDALVDGDVTLTALGGTASLVSGDLVQTLSDGGRVFFLGVVDPTQTFTSATLDFPPDGDVNFVFSVDDVVIALPEPRCSLMLGAGVVLLSALGRSRRVSRSIDRAL